MSVLTWDDLGKRFYETGVDRGVLYIPTNGIYSKGVPWSGLVSVSESPSGAEATPQYADNIKYLNLVSAEEFGATIEAFTYPDEFLEIDGSAAAAPGIRFGQQPRKTFGFSYRTKIGNDTDGQDHAYKLHLVYGALAAPSEKAYNTVNDSPEAITFSWEITTTPVPVPGFKPTSIITIDSREADPTALAALEAILYGDETNNARLPMPAEIAELFVAELDEVEPTEPTFVAGTGVITIPSVAGVVYHRGDNNAVVTGTVTIPTPGQSLTINAVPDSGYKFPDAGEDSWVFTRTA